MNVDMVENVDIDREISEISGKYMSMSLEQVLKKLNTVNYDIKFLRLQVFQRGFRIEIFTVKSAD